MRPEVTLNDEFGKTLYKVISKFTPKSILEIGSGSGNGSTKCITKSIIDNNIKTKLTCVEAYNPNFLDLIENTKSYEFVECFNQNTLSYETFLPKDFDKDVWECEYNKLRYTKDVVYQWYVRDVVMMKETSNGFLDNMTTEFWDIVLIDGGEFNGYSEYSLLKDKTNIFLLDDVHHAYKCNQVYNELLTSDKWELLFNLPHVRNGAAGFKVRVL